MRLRHDHDDSHAQCAACRRRAARVSTRRTKRALSFVDSLDMPDTLGSAGVARRQADPVRDGQARLEGQPAHRPHLPHQRRRHQSDATHVRRARRIEPALVAGRQDDRLYRPARRGHQQSDLSARHRRRRSPPRSPIMPRRPAISPGRPTASRSGSRPPTPSPLTNAKKIASRTMCMRSRRRTSSSVTSGRRDLEGKTKKITDGDFSVTVVRTVERREAAGDGARAVAAPRALALRRSVDQRRRRRATPSS